MDETRQRHLMNRIDAQLDSGPFHLDDGARIDGEPSSRSSHELPANPLSAAGIARDGQRLGQDVHDVRIIETGGNIQGLDRSPDLRLDSHEQSVDTVLDHQVVVDLRTDAPVGLFKAGGIRRNGG